MRQLLSLIPFILIFFALAVLIQRFGNQDLLTVYLCFAIIVPLVYLLVDRFRQQNSLLAMKQEALQAELALLKSQINPHFFFNTLNNLYGLVVAKSDLAPGLILKLSDLMRFTLYQGKKERVFLRDEIAYLENYLAIQEIRVDGRRLSIKFEKKILNDLVSLTPLLLILLVENAVKHGPGSLVSEAFIHLYLEADERNLRFEIENNFQTTREKSVGLGLANLERRLVLLYPNRHDYSHGAKDGVYRASLSLAL